MNKIDQGYIFRLVVRICDINLILEMITNFKG